jgi:cobyrinic acid a,c-diamide synthase
VVIDAKGQARSAAALAQGFSRFDRAALAGLAANRVGGPRHAEMLALPLRQTAVAAVRLPDRNDACAASRHLGWSPPKICR